MVVPTLNVEEYQYKDDGLILNADAVVVPFIDVDQVSGLDATDLDASSHTREQADGGYIEALYENMRTVIVDGTLYADVLNMEPYLDDLKANYGPSPIALPFYFMTDAGIRVVYGKSLGAKYDKTTLRRNGRAAVQVQIVCEDPRIYATDEVSGELALGVPGEVTDYFNRPDASVLGTPDVGAAWAPEGSVWGIEGGKAKLITGNASWSGATVETGLADITIMGPWDVLATGGATSGYKVRSSGVASSGIGIFNNGIWNMATTTLVGAAPSPALAAGDWVKVTARGSSITVFRQAGGVGNWVQVASATDPSFTANTKHGLAAFGTTNPLAARWNELFIRVPDAGRGYNKLYTYGYGATAGVTADSTILSLGGNRDQPGVIRIDGPISNPSVTHLESGTTISFIYDLLVGNYIEINLNNRTIKLNGATGIRGKATLNGDWYLLQPGINTFTFEGSATDATTTKLTVTAKAAAWR